MSPRTPRLDGPPPPGPADLGPQRLSAPRRFAAVGLLALSMMLPLGAGHASEVCQLIRDAQSQTETIDADLGAVDIQLDTLPATLRVEVAGALDSARAATQEARAALAAASTDQGAAVVALADAQVALDAAFAQVRYVTDLAHAASSDVTVPLHRLQAHLDELRGETDHTPA